MGTFNEVPTNEQIKELDYIKAIVNETLRFYPPVVRLPGKINLKEMEINGYKIPPKSAISIHFMAMHHDPHNFENPTEFEPERFLNHKNYGIAYTPFSHGERKCTLLN